MENKQYGVVVILAIVAGFIGGVVSSQMLTTPPVFAQKSSDPSKFIKAQKFIVVGEDGTELGGWGSIGNNEVTFFLGKTGKGGPRIVMHSDETVCGLAINNKKGDWLNLSPGQITVKGVTGDGLLLTTLGYTGLAIIDPSETPRAFFGKDQDKVIIDVRSKSGKRIWSAP
jgi:hypothetical protein